MWVDDIDGEHTWDLVASSLAPGYGQPISVTLNSEPHDYPKLSVAAKYDSIEFAEEVSRAVKQLSVDIERDHYVSRENKNFLILVVKMIDRVIRRAKFDRDRHKQ